MKQKRLRCIHNQRVRALRRGRMKNAGTPSWILATAAGGRIPRRARLLAPAAGGTIRARREANRNLSFRCVSYLRLTADPCSALSTPWRAWDHYARSVRIASAILVRGPSKIVPRRSRTQPRKKEGCAERIAPIGTLSQNGYGEDL